MGWDMKRRKPGKALEKIARQVNDSDQFLEHIGNISNLYRREHALDATPRGSAARQSLKTFRKHAGALADWLKQAHKENASTPEHDALNKIGELLYGSAPQAHTASKSVADWLSQADDTAGRCLDDVRMFPRKPQRNAPTVAGSALRATFEHHKLKLSTAKEGDAVRLLVAIAKDAGDAELSVPDARQALGKKK
jgi:hypothetical protein